MPRKISLDEWDVHYEHLRVQGLTEPFYGGPLRRHVCDGDFRLLKLQLDNSPAALRLWNFLLTEEDRLHQARREGKKIVGTMKDLGTVPVLAFSFPDVVAFYPDGAWWIPCVMELSAGLLNIADSLGIDESFCPVRAMLGAFETRAHFPIPDRLFCSVGATCDDFSAIAQRLEAMGHPIIWWEMPPRREPEEDEASVRLPSGFSAPQQLIDLVKMEFQRIREELETLTHETLPDERIREGIHAANRVRALLDELRLATFTAERTPLPALEMQIAEMLAIHFCSNREETINVLQDLLEEVHSRIQKNEGILSRSAVRVFWINPVADLRLMNWLEECGGRLCGSEYLFCHALDPIPEDLPPMEALARMALADPMVGSSSDRAERICRDIRRFGAQAAVISRIPGASHCALEGRILRNKIQTVLDIPVIELEAPPLADSMEPTLRTRLEALVETVKRK